MGLFSKLRSSPLFIGILIGAFIGPSLLGGRATTAIALSDPSPPALAPSSIPKTALPDAKTSISIAAQAISDIVGVSWEKVIPLIELEPNGQSSGVFTYYMNTGSSAVLTGGGMYVIQDEMVPTELNLAFDRAEAERARTNPGQPDLVITAVIFSLYGANGSGTFMGLTLTFPDGVKRIFYINPLRARPNVPSTSLTFGNLTGFASTIATVWMAAGGNLGGPLVFPPTECLGTHVDVGTVLCPSCPTAALNNYNLCICGASQTYNAKLWDCSIIAALSALSCAFSWTLIGAVGCVGGLVETTLCFTNAALEYRRAIEQCDNDLAADRSKCRTCY